jgi:hypothetical protein
MKFFTVYMNPEAKIPLESLVFIPNRLSVWAAIFQAVWALYNRMWALAAILATVVAVCAYLRSEQVLSVESVRVVNFAVMAYIGFSASDLRERHLKSKGYVLMDVVAAKDEMEAQQRFLDQYFIKNSQQSAFLA